MVVECWVLGAWDNAFRFAVGCCCLRWRGFVYCTNCGAVLKEDDKFCPVCGAAVAKVRREEYSVSGSNLVDRVRELLHEGNVTRIIVMDDKGKRLLEIPATVGVVGVVLAPWLMALGVVAALVTSCRIVVERRE